MDEHLIDKRVIQRHLAKGKVDPKEYDRLLAALPDLADRVVRGAVESDHDEDDAEDDADDEASAEPAAAQASVGG